MGVPEDRDAFGLDIFIGEPDVVGTGVGSATVDLVCRTLFAERDASCVALLTAVGNEQAQRAYEKAGMRKVRRALDTDIKDGKRVESWLMIRDRARGVDAYAGDRSGTVDPGPLGPRVLGDRLRRVGGRYRLAPSRDIHAK